MEEKTPRPPENGNAEPAGSGGAADRRAGEKKAGKADVSSWKLLGLGLQLALTVAVFAWLGKWLQGRYGWPDWTTIAFASFGIAVGLYYFVKETQR